MGAVGPQDIGSNQALGERKAYLEDRNWLFGFEHQVAESFDKYIITLSGGALGLSLTFIRQIAPNPLPYTLPWLYLSWAFFALALLAVLASLLFSQHAFRREVEIRDLSFANQSDARQLSNRWSALTNWLNWISLVAFILGVASMAFFSIANPPQP